MSGDEPALRACARCGFENPPAFKFCGQCAASLAADAPAPASAPESDGERRRVTVLFCDLVGAAQLSERLDPEDMHRVVRAYQSAAESVIERHGGHIAQYLGDGLLVYFGYPEEREGSAKSAVLAALEIVQAVEGLASTQGAGGGVDIAARVGMHSGEGIAGDVGGRLKREQLVVGRAPNIAARLREMASPGTVLASDATKTLVEDDVETLSLGEHALRGIAEPIGVFRMLWKKGAPASTPGEVVREAPFVGRADELTTLFAAAFRATQGNGQVVLVSGVEGSGKSRLKREARSVLAARGVVVQVARCRAKARLVPLTPFLEVLEKLVGSDALVSALRTEPLTPKARSEHNQSALADLVVRAAEERPLALFVEDLHLADPSTLALFAELCARISAPDAKLTILLCATFSPPFEPMLPAPPSLRINLEPLDERDARALLQAAWSGPLPAAAAQSRILERAGGLPLLILEISRATARSGELPQDLQSAVLATLAGVGPAREVAWMASVLGPRFERGALSVLCPFDPAMFSRLLNRLTDAGILAVEADGELSFSHALVRDAIYEAISPVRRRDAHEKAARALASSTTSAPEDVLTPAGQDPRELRGATAAWHLSRAGLAEEAADVLARAARAALMAGAGQEALEMLARALSLVTENVERARRARLEVELRALKVRVTLALSGASDPALAHELSRARELCRKVDAPIEALHVVRAQWIVAAWHGNGPAALAQSDELLALAARGGPPPFRTCAALVAGTTAFFRGRLDEAVALLERAASGEGAAEHRTSIEQFGADVATIALSLRARIKAVMGARDASLESFARAWALAQSLTDPIGRVEVAVAEVMARCDLDEPEYVLSAAKRAFDLASRQRLHVSAAAARCGLGWARSRMSSPEEGAQEIERGLAVMRAEDRTLELAYFSALYADALMRARRYDDAASALSEAMGLAGKQLDAVFKPEVLRRSGDLARARDRDPERASALYQRAAETARTYGALSWAVSAEVELARTLVEMGRTGDATAVLDTALRGAESLGDTAPHRAAKALRDDLARS